MINEDDFLKRTVTIQRVLHAPIAVVWEAWSNPEHIVKWWNPRGSNTTIEAHEFNVGGKWKYTMMMPNGKPFIAEGTYTEIVHHERICSTADFKPMTEGVVIQSLFESIGDDTAFTFHVVHPTEDYKLRQERMGIQNGWGSVFERLEEFISENKNHNV